MNPERVTVPCWAQIRPVWNTWWPNTLRGATVVRVTKRKPKNPEPGVVLVRIMLHLPISAFIPPQLEVEAEVPAELCELVPALIEVAEPS